jgi:ethanolamine utilization microcompartment shell protein EutL
MLGLLKSRKFWITIFDIVVATATYFVTKYVAPEIGEDVLWLIAAWQPVIIALITGIAVEDAALKSAGLTIEEYESPSGPQG